MTDDSTKRPRVLGAGLLALDLVVGLDPESPIQAWAGGTCGNVMSMLAWHGWESYPIARLDQDPAATRVLDDLERWGVKLDLANCGPSASTPIIVQEIKQNRHGANTHKFSWSCLRCGGWLPSFKPITRSAVEQVEPFVSGSAVFFFDRVSRGTLELAARAASEGAVIMFEPSGRGDDKMFREALELANIVKYADQRMSGLAESYPSSSRILEIQTLGAAGLRFRAPQRMKAGSWRNLPAAMAETVADSCGSGDWCTAGLLSALAPDGLNGLVDFKVAELRDGLRYGQELAAWNCQFEGARGGMYSDSRTDHLRVARRKAAQDRAVDRVDVPLVSCPKCAA